MRNKESEKCMFCLSSRLKKNNSRRSLKWDNTEFSFLYCSKCRGFSLYPPLTNNQLKVLYSDDYSRQNGAATLDYQGYLDNHGYDYSTRYLKQYLNAESLICDFGCGVDTTILNVARSFGSKYFGVEYNELVVSSLSNMNSDANYFTVEKFFANDLSFDFIFIGDVLEHVTSPVTLLTSLSLKLNPGGKMVIQGPLENSPSLLHFLVKTKSRLLGGSAVPQPPYHVSLASSKSLFRLFLNCNLSLEEFFCYEVWWPVIQEKKGRIFGGLSFPQLAKRLDLRIHSILPRYGNRFFAIAKSPNLHS